MIPKKFTASRSQFSPVWSGFFQPLLCALLVAVLVLPMQAQQAAGVAQRSTDLSEQNLSRVAASAAQIEIVLRTEPGLLVELKRWVAKEATDRGQLIGDQDLSDAAIYARLKDDLEFRSVATRLLQRYGFLMPRVNPDSELAVEREALLKERGRMQALTEATKEGTQLERASSAQPEGERQQPEGTPRTKKEVPAKAPRRAVPDLTLPAPESGTLPGEPIRRIPGSQRTTTVEIFDGLNDPRFQRVTGYPSEIAGQPARAGEQTLTEPERLRPMERLISDDGSALPPRQGEVRAADRDKAVSVRAGALPSDRDFLREKVAPQERLRRTPNPYADIPSLHDMYRQLPFSQANLRRFGADIFEQDYARADLLPMDLPVGPDYVVGPGDSLAVDLWGGYSLRILRTVDQEGRIALPEVGPVLVSGKTLGEVQQSIQKLLRTQFRDVSADVSLARLRTVRVYVVGDVVQPGAYDVSSLSTPLNALFEAGGPSERGSLRILRHFRGKQLVQEVDVYDLLLRGVRSDVKRVENGDTVLVPPLTSQVRVEGMVRRPALYELRGETSLAEVLELAGGVLPTATLRNVQVQRVEAHTKVTMLSVDLSEDAEKDDVPQPLATFVVKDGDEIRVFPMAPHNQDAVYLQGHVIRPGRYAFRDGMRLTDLIRSFQDLLPEPYLTYGEIVRLNPPDFHPSVEGFNLRTALEKPEQAPKLHPLDTVRIFSRFDFENPPVVTVLGEVRYPGTYRTSGVTHLRDAVYLAGGVTLDTQMESAQVFRHESDSRLKIFSVNLAEALTGDPLHNVLLQPRDRILLHRNLAKVDPPSVFIKGEVSKPGRFPLTTNLRVGDLIRLAGGLKRGAFAERADLTRYVTDGSRQQSVQHLEISIAAALSGESEQNLLLRDGDTLTIRQLPGWTDLGATITVRGEVAHPGVYGILPGEKLSSVLRRAGGFLPTAFPRGAVFTREDLREFQEKTRLEMIQRIEQDAGNIKVAFTESVSEAAALQQAALQQRQRAVERLKQAPVSGRLVVNLNPDLAAFARSSDDIELRAGDALYIPKRPDYVLVTGQVYNSNAIAYVPRKNAGWYLRAAGGPTKLAEKSAIFIVRANGAVISGNVDNWWSGGVLSTRIEPGDTIVVPEKAIGPSPFWKNLATIAQLFSASAIAASVALR